MAETKIQWADYVFNPWRGCTKVSPGCQHCYAEQMSLRNPAVLGEWGPQGTRVVAAESYWRQPLKWDREAKAAGQRRRVFCASLSDVFEERAELTAPLCRVLKTIHLTPHLDWLLLTKRPEAFWRRMDACRYFAADRHLIDRDIRDGGELAEQWGRHAVAMPNAWAGVSVEDQQRADERIPHLLQIPAAVRFLSVEPLLGPVDLKLTGWAPEIENERHWGIAWVIIGGESGPHARPCHVEWVRDLVRQCREAGVACFVKQLGKNPRYTRNVPAWRGDGKTPIEGGLDTIFSLRLRDPKGGDPLEWPEDLRVREFPR